MANTTLVYATVVKLVAQHDGRLRATHGEQANAAFYNIVNATDPILADALHEDAIPRKPFTVSPLQGLNPPVNGYVDVEAGQETWLRFTLLDGAVFQPFVARFLQHGRPVLRIGGMHFEMVEALTTPGSHPRAGYTVLNALLRKWRDYPGRLPDTVTLRFITPTAFRVGRWPGGQKRFLLWPDPERVWYGLRRNWEDYGGDDSPGKAYNDWVEAHVSVIEHGIRTRMLEFDKHPQVGFVGRATFRAWSRDREAMALWHALADFAFYAGVGEMCPKGMGQAERIENDG